MRHHRLLLIASLCCGALALTAGEDLPDWKKPYWPKGDRWKQTPQEFTFGNEAEPETLDPQIMTGVLESRLAMALFEGLVTQDPKTLEIRPGVAERWELSADLTVYTFHLRADAKWWDGTLLTSADFIASWKRALDPATGVSYAYLMHPIRGAEAFNTRKTADFATVGIAAPDPRTLVVTLAQPCPYFLELTAFPSYAPVPVARIAKHGDRWVLPEHLLGNGPFKLTEWKPRERIVMERSDTYWDRGFVKLAKLIALPIVDTETSYKLWQQGQMHWLPRLPTAKLDTIRRDGDYYAAPYFGTYFYRFNVTRAPFDDVRVRQAVALAIDRKRITDHVVRGGEQPTGSLCPPVGGYDPGAGMPYDRERARKLLADYATAKGLNAAGVSGGKPFPTIELMFNTDDRHKQIAEAVAQQWQDVLGVTVSLANREWKVYLSDMDKLNYQTMRSSWIGDYGDPSTFYEMFKTGGGNNRTGWSEPRYDALCNQAAAEGVAAKRHALFKQLEGLLAEACPIAPIYRYVAQGLLREAVRGFERNVRDNHPWQYVWLEP